MNIGDVNTTEDLASVLADKIVYIQSDLKAPIRLPGIPNERVFLMMQQYNALAVIFTNPLTSALLCCCFVLEWRCHVCLLTARLSTRQTFLVLLNL